MPIFTIAGKQKFAFALFILLGSFIFPFNNPAQICADINFRQAPDLTTGANTKAVASGDFDGDGKTDVAAVFSNASYGVAVLRNSGGSNFAPHQDLILPSGAAPSGVFARDLNADGKADLVVTYDFTRKISVFQSTSAGGAISFAPQVDYAVNGAQTRVAAFGDFDADGKPDVVALSSDTTQGIAVFRNVSGAGGAITFEARADFPLPSGKVIALADFDADGKLDIALGTGFVRNLSSGAGNIGFSSWISFDFGFLYSMTAGDFDADGKTDVAITQSNGTQARVYRNTSSGAGSFTFAQPENFDAGMASTVIVSADLDGDGKTDLATANQSSNSVSVLRNSSTGAGTINFAARAWDFGAGIMPYHMTLGDFNADQKPDLVTANFQGGSASVLINSSQAGQVDFIARKDYLTPLLAGVSNVSAADFDGDGNTDLAVSFDEIRNAFRFSIYRNDGAGHFPTRIDVTPPPPPGITNLEPFITGVGDFDGDGKPDVAMLGAWRDQVLGNLDGLRIYRNTSSAPGVFSFQVTNYFHAFNSPLKLWFADLDADGKTDIIATDNSGSGGNQTARVFRNTSGGAGSFSFASPVNLTFLGNGGNISSADLNVDNKIDLAHLSTVSFPWAATIELNTSAGPGQIGFSPQNLPQQPDGFGEIVLADIDGDSKMDVISDSDADILAFRNTSSAGVLSFEAPVVFSNIFLKPAASGDFNGDGKIDVAAAPTGSGGEFISILKNTTTGSALNLSAGAKFAVGGNSGNGSITSRITADLDNNGKPDVVTGFKATIGAISVLLSKECAAQTRSPFDFDGDGKTDISIFRPSAGEWWYLRSSDGGNAAAQFGNSADKLTPADFTGDGKTDVGIWRPATGEWFVLRSEDGSYYSFPFGTNGDVPAPADFDADGKADAGVFRPSTGTWYITRSTGGTTIQQFGQNGDVPVAADYDADGSADIAIYRVSAGEWWIQRSTAGLIAFQFGGGADKPVQGDYTGDGKADVALFRPSSGEWFVLRSEDFSYYSFPFGISTDVPAPGDYDGDGKFDAAVFRPSAAAWYVQRSTAGTLIQAFGQAGDRPVPSAFVP